MEPMMNKAISLRSVRFTLNHHVEGYPHTLTPPLGGRGEGEGSAPSGQRASAVGVPQFAPRIGDQEMPGGVAR